MKTQNGWYVAGCGLLRIMVFSIRKVLLFSSHAALPF